MTRSQYFTEEHESFRDAVRRFVEKEITPHVLAWEEAEAFPRDILTQMGELGYLGIHYPEDVGGVGLDFFYSVVWLEELSRCGVSGFPGAVAVHSYMASPPLLHWGSERVRREYLTPSVEGRKVAALGITEPNCGSDVAAIRTTGTRDGDHWIVNGSKTFITNGCIADYVTTAVRTSPGNGHDGISLFVIDTGTPGFIVSKKLKKLGWHSSDTAEITFDNCRIPADCLLGEEGRGFYYVMQNFQQERLVAAVLAMGGMDYILGQTLEYARTRQAFGKPLAKLQVLRHLLVDLSTEVEAARQLTYHAAWLYAQGENAIQPITMAKLYATELAQRVSDRCLQVYGGYGFMEEYPAARSFRDARLGTIGGGTSEIMREILSSVIVDQRVLAAPKASSGNGHPSCQEIFATLPQRLKSTVGSWESRILFEISGDKGGTFTVHVHEGKCDVYPERVGTPDCTVQTDDATYLSIEQGQLKPEAAFMAGRVRIDDVGAMMKYAASFEPLR